MPAPLPNHPIRAREGSSSDPNFYIFLLLGQSNMEGIAMPEEQDCATDPSIFVLAYDDLRELGREYNQWYVAAPPLHSNGTGVGPGDYFAKTLIAALPRSSRLGLVPCGIKGVDIDFFRKGVISKRRPEFPIPPDNHWAGAYEWVIHRARLAQKAGAIRGILFHQGESDSGKADWLAKVEELVRDLRADLKIGESVPFLAGELYRGGRCASHNEQVSLLPHRIANSFVISADGLTGSDQYHFDLPSQRELGRRFGQAMIEVLGLRQPSPSQFPIK